MMFHPYAPDVPDRDPGLRKRAKDPEKEKDPWVLPSTSEIGTGRSMPFSVVELAYQCIQTASADAEKNLHLQQEYDEFTWAHLGYLFSYFQ